MSDHQDNNHGPSPLQAKKARAMWLASNPDMDKVEELYRTAIGSEGKKRKREEDQDLDCWRRIAVEQLCMILCQSGRAPEAKAFLQPLGYTCRLASCILDYPTNNNNNNGKKASSIPCHIWDHFLSPQELQHLRQVFLDPQADYWTSHNYQVEPPSPYFSYIVPLSKDHKSVDPKFGGLGTIVASLHQHLIEYFPKLASATAVELWAHNRPHPTGHQFHFDSDNEGQGRIIKNPIMTAILYLTGGGGGPSVVTNQTLVSRHLASRAVMSPASCPGRLVAFEGNLLHGVIPGKGSHTGQRRVTLMLAYWRRIRVRPSDQPGAARPFPFDDNHSEWSLATKQSNTARLQNCPNWNQLLVHPLEDPKQERSPVPQDPISLDRVYETLDGEPWRKSMGFPEYDQVFQGF